MTQADEASQLLLSRARDALTPSQQDERRVLARLAPALALPLAAAGEVPALPRSAWRRSQWWVRGSSGVLALAVAGAAGYGWGYRAGLAAGHVPAAAGPSRPVLAQESLPSAPRSSHEADTPNIEARPPARSRASVSGSHALGLQLPAASIAAPAPGLDEEVRQLRRIEGALRDGNPRLAVVLVENLDREIPAGQLLLERRAAVLMASCQLDAEGASAGAAQFIARNPGSVYAKRLREVCRLQQEQRNDEPAGTNNPRKAGAR